MPGTWSDPRRVLAALAVYVGAIVGSNALTAHFGLIPVGFGLMATAGTWCAAVSFPARDCVQRFGGRWLGLVAILVGAALSWLTSPSLAVASGVTYLLSESCDWAIYTPLQKRFAWAVLVSGCVAAVIDSLVFLKLAGIPYSAALAGLIFAKLCVQPVGFLAALRIRKAVLA